MAVVQRRQRRRPVTAPLINLTLFDVDEQTLVDNAKAAIQTQIPTWQPIEGNTEVVLIEASALLVATTMFTINQLGRSVLDNLVALQGVTRLPPAQAVGTVQVTCIASNIGTVTLPTGSTFRIYNVDGSSVDLVTTAAATVTPLDDSAVTFPAQVIAPAGVYPNLIPAGTDAVLVDVLTWVDSAVTGVLTGGADTEGDDAFYLRAATWFATQNRTLVLPAHFAAAALNVSGVGRSVAVDRWDGLVLAAIGTVAGHVTVVVATPTGGACSAPVKAEVTAELTAGATAGLNITVQDPRLLAFVAAVTVKVAAGFPPADVAAAVTRAVQALLDPATRGFGQPLYLNQLIVAAGEVAGVELVVSATGTVGGIAAASYTPGPFDLPAASPTVTVTAT
jgi:uncharacterized phage protein gp47/JayE